MGIYNDKDMLGRILDTPEPVTCNGEFDKDKCICCVGYDKCKKEAEENENSNRSM